MKDRITLRQLLYTDEWNGDIIYFIGSPESRKVKIGKSSNTQFTSRLGELQIGSPDKLTVLGIIKGGTRKEADLHTRFAQSHYRGEWFDLTDDITSYIEGETFELVQSKKFTEQTISDHVKPKKKLCTRKCKQKWTITPVIWCDVCKCYHELKREKQLEWPTTRCIKWGA